MDGRTTGLAVASPLYAVVLPKMQRRHPDSRVAFYDFQFVIGLQKTCLGIHRSPNSVLLNSSDSN